MRKLALILLAVAAAILVAAVSRGTSPEVK